MMDPATHEALSSTRDTARAVAGEQGALADHLTAILDHVDPVDPQDEIDALTEALTLERAAHEATRAAHDAKVEELADVSSRLAQTQLELHACLADKPPPPPPPPGNVKVWRPPTDEPTDVLWNPTVVGPEIRRRIGGHVDVDWPNDAAYVDRSEGIQFHANGGMSFFMDPAKRRDTPQNTGGTNWVNAAMPLRHPGTDVELRYRAELPPDRGKRIMGRSIKFPGLSTITGDQQAPGGGVAGPGQMIVRTCLSDWNGDDIGWIGPYSYWPVELGPGTEKVNTAGGHMRLWHPEREGFSIWWYADKEPNAFPGSTFDVSLRIQRTDTGWLVMNSINQRLITYTYDRHPDEPDIVSHMAFVVMYGGNTPDYGPDEPTVLRIDDLQVITHR